MILADLRALAKYHAQAADNHLEIARTMQAGVARSFGLLAAQHRSWSEQLTALITATEEAHKILKIE